jgi:IS30 family transposase
MPKTRELSEFERGRIIGGHELGHSFAEIARKWNHDESTVRRIVPHAISELQYENRADHMIDNRERSMGETHYAVTS